MAFLTELHSEACQTESVVLCRQNAVGQRLSNQSLTKASFSLESEMAEGGVLLQSWQVQDPTTFVQTKGFCVSFICAFWNRYTSDWAWLWRVCGSGVAFCPLSAVHCSAAHIFWPFFFFFLSTWLICIRLMQRSHLRSFASWNCSFLVRQICIPP